MTRIEFSNMLTLTRSIGSPQTPVAQKFADQRWLIANSGKIGTFFILNDVTKG